MHQIPSNLQEVRENLAEAAYTAWIDKSFLPRSINVINAMGKMISSVAVEVKAADLNRSEVNSTMLPLMNKSIEVKQKAIK